MSDSAILHGGGVPLVSRIEGWRQAWLGIDRNEDIISFVRTGRGAVLLHLAFFVVIMVNFHITLTTSVLSIIALTFCAAFPKYRLQIIALAGFLSLFGRPLYSDIQKETFATLATAQGVAGQVMPALYLATGVIMMLALTYALLRIQKRFHDSFIAKRPVQSLILIYAAIVAFVYAAPLSGKTGLVAWCFLLVLSSLLWFIAYAMADNKVKDATPDMLRPGFFRPFWGGNTIPIGKGPAYLKKFEAKDDSELAVTRLKALKLGVWGALITAFYISWVAFTHDRLGVPTLLEALALDAAGTPLPVWLDWLVVLNNYLVRVLEMCASFHIIVAIIRMAGYRIPRNTARPLSSRTLADFWNRYNYYFKEFLVDFFFFPAFLRFFKKHPKLRLAFATFCAATVGNLIYHFSRDVGLAVERGVAGTFLTFDTYAFYCLILTAGLIISQMRGRKPAPDEGFFRYQVLPRVNVGIFFCLLGVFDDVKGHQTLGEHLVFFGHLFGVSL